MGAMYPRGMLAVVLLLATVATAVAQTFTPQITLPSPPIQRWYIHVVSKLKNATLFVHCKSKDDDLGNHNLAPGAEFQWNFKVNILGTTLFWCFLQKPSASVSFEVFWPEKQSWLKDRCVGGNCIWTARDDGIYLLNPPEHLDEFVHKWVPSQPRREQ